MKYSWFLVIILSFLFSCSFSKINKNSIEKKHSVNKSDKDWTKIHQILNKKAESFGFDVLSEKEIFLQNTEIRIWVMGGLTGIRGIILQKINGENTAFLLPSSKNQNESIKVTNLPPPKLGWERFWKNLENENIFSLPDESEVHNPQMYNDGQTVIIESKYKGIYNIYSYSEPMASDIEQAKNVSNIIKIINDEFNVSLYMFPEKETLIMR